VVVVVVVVAAAAAAAAAVAVVAAVVVMARAVCTIVRAHASTGVRSSHVCQTSCPVVSSDDVLQLQQSAEAVG
jgi:hypothetical protein